MASLSVTHNEYPRLFGPVERHAHDLAVARRAGGSASYPAWPRCLAKKYRPGPRRRCDGRLSQLGRGGHRVARLVAQLGRIGVCRPRPGLERSLTARMGLPLRHVVPKTPPVRPFPIGHCVRGLAPRSQTYRRPSVDASSRHRALLISATLIPVELGVSISAGSSSAGIPLSIPVADAIDGLGAEHQLPTSTTTTLIGVQGLSSSRLLSRSSTSLSRPAAGIDSCRRHLAFGRQYGRKHPSRCVGFVEDLGVPQTQARLRVTEP